ncbi:hypothetical protein [Baekduia soli]|uniref:hypothetical protein n=1 Tax=Baekduia soli TaxID=496014 RepID=UPI0016522362|nr:hypothetical protein [Baekduia soli]
MRAGLTSRSLAALDAALIAAGAAVRYAQAANVAWIAWPEDRPLDDLHDALAGLGLAGMVLRGPPGRPLLGTRRGGLFAARVRGALDPYGRFLED